MTLHLTPTLLYASCHNPCVTTVDGRGSISYILEPAPRAVCMFGCIALYVFMLMGTAVGTLRVPRRSIGRGIVHDDDKPA